MRERVIASAARTPTGTFGGSLAAIDAVQLGKVAAEAAIERAGIDKAVIDEVIVGNVLSAGLGQNVARQVAIQAGLPEEVSCLTIQVRSCHSLYWRWTWHGPHPGRMLLKIMTKTASLSPVTAWLGSFLQQ